MSNIGYGWCNKNNYVNAVYEIAEYFKRGNTSSIVDKINYAFFEGGVFDPKSFSALTSTGMPSGLINERSGPSCSIRREVEFTKIESFSAVLGYVEAIPVIGSALAVIGVIGHLFGMWSAHESLDRAVQQLKNDDQSLRDVFGAAVDYTVHYNHLMGSLVSIIPFAKPCIRLVQGALYHIQQ